MGVYSNQRSDARRYERLAIVGDKSFKYGLERAGLVVQVRKAPWSGGATEIMTSVGDVDVTSTKFANLAEADARYDALYASLVTGGHFVLRAEVKVKKAKAVSEVGGDGSPADVAGVGIADLAARLQVSLDAAASEHASDPEEAEVGVAVEAGRGVSRRSKK